MSNNQLLLLIFDVILLLYAGEANEDKNLTVKELLRTVSPDYHQPKLPPGFPSMDKVKADKFDYKTFKNAIRVSIRLFDPVVMYPKYVILSKVGINFTYTKTGPQNGTWGADIQGVWTIGSAHILVNITEHGRITADEISISMKDLMSGFLKQNEGTNIGIDPDVISLENAQIIARVSRKQTGMRAIFHGTFNLNSLGPTIVKITAMKNDNSNAQLYSVMEFNQTRPEIVLRKILSQKVLTIPFFAHMLTSSDLFFKRKDIFGIAISFHEVYSYRGSGMSGHIIRTVLQSHIPVGITLLSHMRILPNIKSALAYAGKRNNVLTNMVKVAFVINHPAFDLLLSQQDKILVSQLLPALSKELSTTGRLQRFNRSMNKAYTTHVGFDSSSTVFSIFVRLREAIQLISQSLTINVTNLVLQRSIGGDWKKSGWKVSAKGVYTLGKATVRVKYSELSNDPWDSYGLTGVASELSLEDILSQFSPVFYPNEQVKEMIENTEIESLRLRKVRIYSRGSENSTTPHMLVTGLANLPEWEKEVQVALLLLYQNKTWFCKWAASLKNSPLSNILQALTGFDSRNLKILHNNHIITTIINSPLPSYSLIPSYIITTRLLRLPVEKALTVVALLPFPDNCGDDKMCQSAKDLLDASKIYTLSGVLSMDEYVLSAKLPHLINITNNIVGENNSLQFRISNDSTMEITTSFRIPGMEFIFDGVLEIHQNGGIEINAMSQSKRWVAPFGMRSISFENLSLNMLYMKKKYMNILEITGVIKLGLQGNRGEVISDVKLDYDTDKPSLSSFIANFSDITLAKLLNAFSVNISLPPILKKSSFPRGLTLSYNIGKDFNKREVLSAPIKLLGDIYIFDRLLNCSVIITHPANIVIVTENSPAPLLFAKGEIIVQKDAHSSLQGPRIIAMINHKAANVTIKGFVKVLGIESDVNINVDREVKFSVAGKMMEYKETYLTAYSKGSLDRFQVSGCLEDIAFQVQLLLYEIIKKSSNQSITNKRKAEQNYFEAQKYSDISDHEETVLRARRDHGRAQYEEHLLEYGRFEVKINDTCVVPACDLKCFGCPRLNKCCRLDIFGHCIACSSWKTCCWKNTNPLCISKKDGCNVIRTAAQRVLAEKEDQILQEKIELDNIDLQVIRAEINKGKHEAVLEAAIDAKQLVEEDSSPGLNAHDAIKNFGSSNRWAKINSVCYDTSIEQASTGCMSFQVAAVLFNAPEQNLSIWSCLKNDLVTELAESVANTIFPNIVDTSDDGITDVAVKLNSGEIDDNLNPLQGNYNSKGPMGYQGSYQGSYNQKVGGGYNLNPHLNLPPPKTDANPPVININTAGTTGAISSGGSMQGHNTGYLPNIKLGPPKLVPGFRPYSGSGSGSASSASEMNDIDDQLKDIYDTNVNEEYSGEDDSEQTQQQQADVPNQIAPAEEEENIANEIVEDEEKEEEKALKDGNIYSDNPYDNENQESNIIQNETNLMLKYRYSYPPKMKKINSDYDRSYLQAPYLYRPYNATNQNTYSEFDQTHDSPSVLPSEYTLDGDLLKETLIRGKHRIRRDINPAHLPLHVIDGEEAEESTLPSKSVISRGKRLSGDEMLKDIMAGLIENERKKSTLTQKHLKHDVQSVNDIQEPKRIRRMSHSVDIDRFFKQTLNQQHVDRKKRAANIVLALAPVQDADPNKRLLFSKPFWDVKSDRHIITRRNNIHGKSHGKNMMTGMLHKRWKIPEDSNGRCHIYHQLIAICKDMADTIVMLDKSLNRSRSKFLDEDKSVYAELFDTEEYLRNSAKGINVSGTLVAEADKTLNVVRQGVNIWSRRCTNEFDWQNQSGVQTWIQTMDFKIQELGGFGVYRFLENLFHAFQALFEVLTLGNTASSRDAVELLQRTHRISKSFDRIFKDKLSVTHSRVFANEILAELDHLKKDTLFC